LSSATARIRAIRVPTANRAVLIGLALLGVGLLASLIYPFASALVFAAALAGALYPQFEKLRARLGGRATVAAGLMTFAVGVLLAAPTAWLAVTVGRQVLTGVSTIELTFRDGGGVDDLIDRLPPSIRERAHHAVERLPGGSDQVQDLAEKQAGKAAAAVTGALVATSTVLLNAALMLIAFFLLLVDGERLVQWIATVAPLPERQILDILSDFRTVSVAVLLSSLGTAGIQSLAALAGYVAAGVPQPLFFGLITFIVAFIPAVGATSVVFVAAGLLLLIGHPQAALCLALWGALVVSFMDNLVKPLLLKDRMEIHGGLIFFALIGGMATFGPVGLVAGPLILSFFLAMVRLCRKELRPAPAPPPVS
jgi:predicted PurR-regulated permease PerM